MARRPWKIRSRVLVARLEVEGTVIVSRGISPRTLQMVGEGLHWSMPSASWVPNVDLDLME